MPKFKIDVELDGYDTMEEMFNNITEDEIYEALSDYGFTVISVKEVERKRESAPQPTIERSKEMLERKKQAPMLNEPQQ